MERLRCLNVFDSKPNLTRKLGKKKKKTQEADKIKEDNKTLEIKSINCNR